MRSGVASILVLGGCGFRASAVPSDAPPDQAVAAIVAAAAGDATGPDAVRSTFCDPMDNLIACYEFEGDTRDGSANQLDAVATNVTFPDGKVGKAMQFGATSSALVSATDKFNASALTIEAWIRLSQLPQPSKESDIVDVNNQYSFSISSDGSLACDVHDVATISTPPRVLPDLWTHVACTYTDGAFRIYVNGTVAATTDDGGSIAAGTNAMALAANSPSGSPLIGLLDQVRIIGAARSASQICTDADQLACL